MIDDHDEKVENHEELYLVLRGRATFTLAGEELDARARTLVTFTTSPSLGTNG